MGKSAFALNLVMNAAKAGKTSLFVSIEMSEKMTTHRLLSMNTGIDLTRLQNSVLSPSEMMQLRKARADLFDLPIYLAATNPMSTQDLRSKCVKLANKSKIDFIVVDYLQMISTAGVNRVTEVGQLSRFLKGLAREMDCPVMALSSLNRAADKREDKRPVMSDLRESGDIESDADLAMFLYRPSYYQPTQLRDEVEDETEVVIGKNRNGPVGIVRLSFMPSHGTFAELEPTLL
jgi:replicative DNA helicase